MSRTTKRALQVMGAMIFLGLPTLPVAVVAGTLPSLAGPELAQGSYSSMHMICRRRS